MLLLLNNTSGLNHDHNKQPFSLHVNIYMYVLYVCSEKIIYILKYIFYCTCIIHEIYTYIYSYSKSGNFDYFYRENMEEANQSVAVVAQW